MQNQKENKNVTTLSGASYKENFAFTFLGQIISQDKRFFETLQAKLNDLTPFIMSSHYMDDVKDREEWFSFLCTVDDLASTTKPLNDERLNHEFSNALKIMGFKKGSEVPHV